MKKDMLLGFGLCFAMILVTLGTVIAFTDSGIMIVDDQELHIFHLDYRIPANLADGLEQSPSIHEIILHETTTEIRFYTDGINDMFILQRDLIAAEQVLGINNMRSAPWIGIGLPNCQAVSPTLSLDFKPQLKDGEWILVGQPNELCSYVGGAE